jgi:hypothetical protein
MLPRQLFEEAEMNRRVSVSAHANPILLDAVKYEFRKDGRAIVSLVAPIFQFHDLISNGTYSCPVHSLRSQGLPGSVAEIPVSNWLRMIDFPADSRLYKLKGVEECGVQSIAISASVDLAHETAFADCFCFEIVRFTPDSRLRLINGFQGCSIVEVRIPESVKLIGRSGFLGCRSLRRVKFLYPRSLIVIAGFSGISCDATIRIPFGAQIAKTAFRGCTALFLVILNVISHGCGTVRFCKHHILSAG